MEKTVMQKKVMVHTEDGTPYMTMEPLKMYSISIYYWPGSRLEDRIYGYPPAKMTLSEAYSKLNEIEEKKPVLPNGIKFNSDCMTTAFELVS